MVDFRCIHCGLKIKTLIVQYSPENIRLVKCENCKAVADEYVECEIMILIVDLILHERKAYRHLLFNSFNGPVTDSKGLLWWLTFGYLFLEAYRVVLLRWSDDPWGFSLSFSSLLWRYQQILMYVLFTNFFFFSILLYGTRIVVNRSDGTFRHKSLFMTVLISSYLKISLMATMVWEFPPSAIFLIDIFVLSSNMVAVKVISGSAANKCMMICFAAHMVKFFSGQMFDMLSHDN